ncbi:MAG: hypothetical protein LC667_15815 [Thioalkalivibrio sp.]|nr:hypothetical protein [Thioalkalivibrio sp.]
MPCSGLFDALAIVRLESSPIRSREARQVIQVLGRRFVPEATVAFFWEGRSFPIPAERTTFVPPVRIDVAAPLFPVGTSWSVVVENPGGAVGAACVRRRRVMGRALESVDRVMGKRTRTARPDRP